MAPLVIGFLGAASNQLVLAANHDKFPVSVNPTKAIMLLGKCGDDEECLMLLTKYGMIDDIHCLMTKDTHLNFLADWIDEHNAIMSPGDLLLDLADWSGNYAPLVWGLLVCGDLMRRKEDNASK